MFNAVKVLLLATLTIGASVFAADVVDDAIKLSNSGVSDEVVQAWAEQQHGFSGTAENIIALKDHKVSDRVIVTLMKGNESTPLTSKVVQDRGWLRRADVSVNTPARSYTVDENVQAQQAPQAVQQYEQPASCVAPATTYVAPSTYVVPSTVAYVDYGYPYYSSYYGYPYYSSYYGYPRYYGYGYYPGISLGFNFGFGHGYGHGYYGGGYGHGGGYYGGYGRGGGSGFGGGRGGSGYVSGHAGRR